MQPRLQLIAKKCLLKFHGYIRPCARGKNGAASSVPGVRKNRAERRGGRRIGHVGMVIDAAWLLTADAHAQVAQDASKARSQCAVRLCVAYVAAQAAQ